MLVAPPGHLKSSSLKGLHQYPTTVMLSDINVQQLIKFREDIVGGVISTLVFSDFEKIYQRSMSVSSNCEGILKAMVEEGFRKASFEDQRAGSMPAHCAIIGAMTSNFHGKKISEWIDNGFSRRFIWCLFKLEDPAIIERAIGRWETLQFAGDGLSFKVPSLGKINYNISGPEDSKLRYMLRYQNLKTPYILLKKVFCVLKWRYPHTNKAMAILEDFAPSLTKDGCTVSIPEEMRDGKKHIVSIRRK